MSTLTMTRDEREGFLADLHVGVISIAEGEGRTLSAPIWYDYEPGGELWIVTDASSRKGRAIARSGRFSLCAQTEQAPYKYVSVEGPISSSRRSDFAAEERPMAHRYRYRDRYRYRKKSSWNQRFETDPDSDCDEPNGCSLELR